MQVQVIVKKKIRTKTSDTIYTLVLQEHARETVQMLEYVI